MLFLNLHMMVCILLTVKVRLTDVMIGLERIMGVTAAECIGRTMGFGQGGHLTSGTLWPGTG